MASSRLSIPLLAWFLAAVYVTQTVKLAPPQPPSWPSTFSVGFHEEKFLSILPIGGNAGAWHYDFGNRTARFDHLQGQRDYFCHGRGLKLKDSLGDCHLLFNTTDMFVHYPREQQCCRACGATEGCTVLKPTWLAGAKYLGTENISGMVCHGWEVRGSSVDSWYQTEDGSPCRLSERSTVFPPAVRNITFNISTYKVDPIPTRVFDIPSYCHVTCPHPYRPPGAGAEH